jgi:hypothetical protein
MDNELTQLESVILEILEGHQGRDNAVSRKDLVDRVNQYWPLFPVNERSIRQTIKHLVEFHGKRIGSCAKGYFIIRTDQELLSACRYYHGYALSLLHIEARLRKMSLAALLGQLSMEFVTQPSIGRAGANQD